MTRSEQIQTVLVSKRPRITSFDVSRGIAITLMVVGHSISATENTALGVMPVYAAANAIFHTVRMPLFFFLAGVFVVDTLRKLGYRNWVIDKAQYLLYPWLVWSIIRGIVETGFYQVGIGSRMTIPDVIYGIVWDPRIWYLPALFVAFAVVGAGYALSRGKRWWPAPMLVVIVGLTLLTYQPWWPPILHVHPFTIYMLGGVVLGPVAIRAAQISRTRAVLVFVAAAIVFASVVWILTPAGLSSDASLSFVACAIPGVVMFIALGRVLDEWAVGNFLAMLGRWSLIIYVIHALPTSIVRNALLRFGVTEYSAVVFISAAFGIGVPALLGWLIDRGHLRWLITMPGYRRRSNTRLP